MTRAEAGLPEDKFVYCCFSHHYKITEEHFADWMEILKRTDNSVLWLIRDNPWSCARLHAAAARMGVDTARVVFADRVPPEKYLARLVLADLFLDTIPYNAGTIASDALRMGVPLVTLSGQTFSARMAGSLLTAVGLPDLVTHTREDYVNLAVSLSGQPERLASIRRHLTEGEAWMKGLGDIGRFAKELEDVYLSVVR
jgi:predicted O-linked N-acetylglucosamine transferase (SPINDLY family)